MKRFEMAEVIDRIGFRNYENVIVLDFEYGVNPFYLISIAYDILMRKKEYSKEEVLEIVGNLTEVKAEDFVSEFIRRFSYFISIRNEKICLTA